MRIAITGGTGFLAKRIAKVAERSGETGILLPRKDPADDSLACDITDYEQSLATLSSVSPNVIIHCAAYGVDHRMQDFVRADQVNISGALNVARISSELSCRYVHVGTAYEYESKPEPLREDSALGSTALYGASKLAGWMLVRAFANAHDLDWVTVRPFGMFGPGENPNKLIPSVITACVRGAPLELSRGHQVRDYLFVDDVAERILALATAERATFPRSGVFNLCSGRARTIRGFVEEIACLFGGLELMNFGSLEARTSEPDSYVGDGGAFAAWCAQNQRMEYLRETPLIDALGQVRRALEVEP